MDYKLKDLPSGCSELVESIEMILALEILSEGKGYTISKIITNGFWMLRIGDLPSTLEIPPNISDYTPAQMRLKTFDLRSVTDLKKFEEDLKAIKVIIIKKESQRRSGYINMGGTSHTVEEPRWELFFADQSKFYDFYFLCKKYGLF